MVYSQELVYLHNLHSQGEEARHKLLLIAQQQHLFKTRMNEVRNCAKDVLNVLKLWYSRKKYDLSLEQGCIFFPKIEFFMKRYVKVLSFL